jgi:DNA-binding MarR family transcriptional regulator
MAKELFSEYSHLLDQTARRVKQYAQQQFNAMNFGITVDQWLVMKNLYHKNDLNQSELAELTGKDHPTLTRIIDLLCKKELNERKIQPNDRRCYTIHLTSSGEDKVVELSPKISKIRMKAWENLSADDYENMKRILNTIYSNLTS